MAQCVAFVGSNHPSASRFDLIWSAISNSEEVQELRVSSMERFLEDFDDGKRQRRYVDAELPNLPFTDASFDLALCSHFLFLYTEQLSEDFHVAAIREMSRVAGEVRSFPLLALGGAPSRHVPKVSDRLRDEGLAVTIEAVPYELQRGGNQMMRVQRRNRAT